MQLDSYTVGPQVKAADSTPAVELKNPFGVVCEQRGIHAGCSSSRSDPERAECFPCVSLPSYFSLVSLCVCHFSMSEMNHKVFFLYLLVTNV